MQKLKIFLAIILLTYIYADQEDDAVKKLCSTYQNEFNQYTAKNGSFKNKAQSSSNALDWIAFFAEKSAEDIAFAKKNKATLNAFFCYGKGFGGINYNVQACDFERNGCKGDEPYESGFVMLYQTGEKKEFKLTANASDQFKDLELEFHKTLNKLQDLYCFVPISGRINLTNLKNNFNSKITSSNAEVKYTAALPIFVNKKGEMFLIASRDVDRGSDATYSVGYGGGKDSDTPEKAFIRELSEELFSRKDLSDIDKATPTTTPHQGKYYRKLLGEELDEFNTKVNAKADKQNGKNLFVKSAVVIATFNNPKSFSNNNDTIEGLLLLPLEILGIQDYHHDKDCPDVEMLNYLRTTAKDNSCMERQHFKIIPLEKFTGERKTGYKDFIPIDRTFSGTSCRHSCAGKLFTTTPMQKIFELIRAPKIN